MDNDTQRPEEPGYRGQCHCLHRQFNVLRHCHSRHLPPDRVQNCIIHQLRNSSKYVPYRELKAFMSDLKAVVPLWMSRKSWMLWTPFGSAETRNVQKFSSPSGPTGPISAPALSTPQEVRRLIYTTNAIEGFNRQLRKVTKAKAVFLTDPMTA